MNSVLPLILAMLAVTDAAVQVQVNPGALQIGNSRNLNIRCSHVRDKVPTISRLSYLLISFASDAEKPVFRYLASVSSVDGLDYDTTAAVAGNITRGGESWLSLTWSYPLFSRVGLYKCEASGINLSGAARTVSHIVEVGGVRHLDASLFDVIQNQSRDFEQLKTDEERLTASYLSLKSRFDRAKEAHFSISAAHNGRRYYLSSISNVLVANEVDAICALYGGYLAEVDDDAEFEFIKSFLTPYTQYTGVLCSGTDEALENNWIHANSKTMVKYIKWSPSDSRGGRSENCLFFWRPHGWFMVDWVCQQGYANYAVGYLCEIPE
ncbi:unnamed protein product [Lymnaea stagnalis]|uniref:C-type lectin domain-containing protein n=1 Tax=Lymnaea stagnalis TaxID=6523 RepID=A0AAV2H7N7_LYMST